MRETVSLMTNRRIGTVLLLVTTVLGAVHCQAILTAPLGSVLRMEANPPFIEANGGVSVISVAVIEPTGTVVPDGTVVQFFTTLGQIDEQGKTNDGIARVNLRSTGLSGVASVTAVSGGEAPAASSTTGSTTPGSTTPGTTTPTSSTRPGPFPTTPGVGIQFGFAEGEGSATMTVAIGSARPTRVVLATRRCPRHGPAPGAHHRLRPRRQLHGRPPSRQPGGERARVLPDRGADRRRAARQRRRPGVHRPQRRRLRHAHHDRRRHRAPARRQHHRHHGQRHQQQHRGARQLSRSAGADEPFPDLRAFLDQLRRDGDLAVVEAPVDRAAWRRRRSTAA